MSYWPLFQVGDRLLSAFGQDTIDALFWTATERHGRKREHVVAFTYHSLWALVYVFCHTVLVLLQATTLNVAINASNKALLTIMMSNNVSSFSFYVLGRALILHPWSEGHLGLKIDELDHPMQKFFHDSRSGNICLP